MGGVVGWVVQPIMWSLPTWVDVEVGLWQLVPWFLALQTGARQTQWHCPNICGKLSKDIHKYRILFVIIVCEMLKMSLICHWVSPAATCWAVNMCWVAHWTRGCNYWLVTAVWTSDKSKPHLRTYHHPAYFHTRHEKNSANTFIWNF